MDRLTAEDQRMLWPDEIWPPDIGALAILDGSGLREAGGGFRIEAVQEGHRPRRARRVAAALAGRGHSCHYLAG